MKSRRANPKGPQNRPGGHRRPVASTQTDWVEVRPLLEDKAIPYLVRCKVGGVRLEEWAAKNRPFVEELFAEHHALLFRGFEEGGIEGFEHFVSATSDGERLEYKDRSTPRSEFADRVYNATTYPPEQSINLHNEGTYWAACPRRIYFGCVLNAETGGETPIGDVHRVYERLAPELRARFEELGVLYVRNFNDGFGLTWQEVFQTEDPAAAEAYGQKNGIEFEWKAEGRLRTRQVRAAVIHHPRSDLPLWFNHAAFFHVSALDAAVGNSLTSGLGPDELPYNTFYGDGSPIQTETVAHILAAYRAEKACFAWHVGDVALYDNLRIAHGREPYTGDRLTLVAMSEPWSPSKSTT